MAAAKGEKSITGALMAKNSHQSNRAFSLTDSLYQVLYLALYFDCSVVLFCFLKRYIYTFMQ